MGYPALSALGKFKEPNIAVIIAGCFHILGLIVLYFTDTVSLMNIVFLTFGTELLVTIIRGNFLHKAYRSLKL
jgi:acyl-CoA synthetase (AMP-forming)/AMP-acid ligase II